MKRSFPLAIVLALAIVQPASAQSIFASQGLGAPVPTADARTRAIGGIGIGLQGHSPSLINPAEAADFGVRGLAVSLQSANHSIDVDGHRADFGANRFPMLRVIYPVGERSTFTVGYGGFLDQTWAVFSDRTDIIGGEEVPVRDRIESDGSISQFQLGVAYALTPELSIGVAGGLYAGGLDRAITREFIDDQGPVVDSFTTAMSWSQRAPFASAGIRWDIASLLRLSGSVTWAGTLKAKGETAASEDFEVDMPLQVAAGLSAYLSPRLLASASGRWSGWSASSNTTPFGEVSDTWEVGGGLEWELLTFDTRVVPLRVGYHYVQFPFRVDGETPSERTFAFGSGLRFSPGPAGYRAGLDAAVERGSRSGGFTEDFWRFTVSLSVFGQ